MHLSLIIISLGAATATFVGGLFAMRHIDKSHLILGFSAGAVIGVAFFDLLPESIALGGKTVTLVIAGAFLLYMIIDRFAGVHTPHQQGVRGAIRATVLCIHSLIDGIAIGLSFQVSPALGTVVAIAVLAHDFSDGINTVTALQKSGTKGMSVMRWLSIDALAPVVGIMITMFFAVSNTLLGPVLAIFCGFFLYISASDLIPESYHAHPTKWTTVMTVLGAGLIYAVISVVG